MILLYRIVLVAQCAAVLLVVGDENEGYLQNTCCSASALFTAVTVTARHVPEVHLGCKQRSQVRCGNANA